jgi:glutamine synthetase
VAIDMVKKQFMPAAIEYATFLADSIASFKSAGVPAPVQEDLLKKISSLIAACHNNLAKLEAGVTKAQEISDTVKKAESYRDKVVTAMQALRTDVDALEMIVPRDMWPVPSYTDLLFKL